MGLFVDLLQIVQQSIRQSPLAVGLGGVHQFLLHPVEPHQLAAEFLQGLCPGAGPGVVLPRGVKPLLGLHRHGAEVVHLVLHGIDAHAVQGGLHRGPVPRLLPEVVFQRQEVDRLHGFVAGEPRLGLGNGIVVQVFPVRHRKGD